MPQGAKHLPLPLMDFHDPLFPDRLFHAIRRQRLTDYGWSGLHPLYGRESVTYLRERGVGPIVYPLQPSERHCAGLEPGISACQMRP